jgi:hypothetical protein
MHWKFFINELTHISLAPIYESVNNRNYEICHILGIGATIPLLLELLYECTASKLLDGVSLSNKNIWIRLNIFLLLSLPRWLVYFIVDYSQFYEAIPCLINARIALIVCMFSDSLIRYGTVGLRPHLVLFPQILFSVSRILSTFQAFRNTLTVGSLIITVNALDLVSGLLYVLYIFSICISILKKSSTASTLNDKICVMHLAVSVFCIILFLTYRTIFQKNYWHEYDANLLIIIDYAVLGICALKLVVNMHVSRLLQRLAQV